MNILFISNDPQIFVEGTAVRTRMCSYAEELAKQGGVLHILARTKKNIEVKDGSLILHGVAGSTLRTFWFLPGRAREIILQYKVGVVSAQDPFEYGLIAARAVKTTSAKLHIQIHTDFLSPWFVRNNTGRASGIRMQVLNMVRVRTAQYVLPRAAGIRVVSKRIQSSLLERYGSRIAEPRVIPIAVSGDVPDAVAFPAHPFTFSLLSVGRLEAEKRMQDMLGAIALIKVTHPSAGLFIANEGRERRSLERLAARLGITNRVLFLGQRADVRGLMRSAHAFIQTSAFEGYGLALIEAALARTPIITTSVGIVGDVLIEQEDVLLAPVGDIQQIAARIARAIEHSEESQHMAENAERHVREHLAETDSSPHAIIQNILEVV